MFAVVYRWRIKPGLESIFEEGWHRGTLAIRRDLEGLGSRLHKIGEGEYFAYALWPDEETYHRNRQARMPYDDPMARKLYSEALEGSEIEVLVGGEIIDDLLASTEHVGTSSE